MYCSGFIEKLINNPYFKLQMGPPSWEINLTYLVVAVSMILFPSWLCVHPLRQLLILDQVCPHFLISISKRTKKYCGSGFSSFYLLPLCSLSFSPRSDWNLTHYKLSLKRPSWIRFFSFSPLSSSAIIFSRSRLVLSFSPCSDQNLIQHELVSQETKNQYHGSDFCSFFLRSFCTLVVSSWLNNYPTLTRITKPISPCSD